MRKKNDIWYDYDLTIFSKSFWMFFKYAWLQSLEIKSLINRDLIGGGKSRFFYFMDMCWCYLRYGATTNDYKRNKFYKLKASYRDTFLTFRRYIRLIQQRMDFDTHFVCRDWCVINKETSLEFIYNFIDAHKGDAIVKAMDEMQGNGIYKVSRTSVSKIENLMLDLKSGKEFLLEEVIENIEEIKNINPSTLNTIRVNTFLDKNANVHILSVVLRVGGANADVDNWAAGGVVYLVDKKDGIIKGEGLDKKGNFFVYHPSTNVKVSGFEVPNFNKLISWVKNLAIKNNKAKLVGWDIAVTNSGFELIEGNFAADEHLIQLDGIGKYRFIIDNW